MLYLKLSLVMGKSEQIFILALLYNLIFLNSYESYVYQVNNSAQDATTNLLKNLLLSSKDKNLVKINEYLTQNVKTDNIEENLQKANELLKLEERKNSLLFNRGFVKALQRFVKLNQIKGDNKCNMNSYSILFENNESSLGGQLHKVASEISQKSMNKLQTIIYKQSLDHALECQEVYFREYTKLLSEIDLNLIKKVRVFQDNLFGEFLFNRGKFQDDTPKSELIATMNQLNGLKSKKVAHIAYDSIEELAHNDPDKKYLKVVFENKDIVLRSDKVKELFVKYLIEPCEYFTKEFDKIFVPYEYDRLMLEPAKRQQQQQQTLGGKSEEELKFFVTLSRHKLCKLLVENERTVLLENVTAVAYNGGL